MSERNHTSSAASLIRLEEMSMNDRCTSDVSAAGAAPASAGGDAGRPGAAGRGARADRGAVGRSGGQSAVIDVNRARAAPIPIALPVFAGADPASQQLGTDIVGVISNDLASSGLFRVIDQAAYIQAAAAGSDVPNFQNWAAIGAQALVTGRVAGSGGGVRVEFRLWDVLPHQQIQGTAYTTTQANWRRIAHIIADVIYQRLLGEKGYFDTRIVYVALTGPRGRETRRLAIMDQDGANNRYLTNGSWAVLTPRFLAEERPDRLHELRQRTSARLSVRSRVGAADGAGRFPGHDAVAAILAGRKQRDHGSGAGAGIIDRGGGCRQSGDPATDQRELDRCQPMLQPGRIADRVQFRSRR